MLAILVVACVAAVPAAGQYSAGTTPVPILRQVSTSNDDGSYTYGYEAADGSFRLETRSAAGAVTGKYGYRDESGELRTVEYGADKLGFQPAGKGITVAPPTLVDNSRQDYDNYDYNQGSGGNDYSYNYNAAPAAPSPVAAPSPAFSRQLADFDSRIGGLFGASSGARRFSAPAPAPAPAPPTRARSQWTEQQHRQAADIAHSVDYKTGSYSLSYVG